MKLMSKFFYSLYTILSKSDEKYRKYRQNFMYSLKQCMVCTAPTFAEPVKNMDNMGANSLMLLCKG